MENPNSLRPISGAVEENILAFLDSNEADDTQYANDDRAAFLDAVRAASLVPENGTPPTYKWFKSIFAILRIGKSLELIMTSFKLLNELDKCYPRVCLSSADERSSSSKITLIVDNEAWSPFALSEREAANTPRGLVDSFEESRGSDLEAETNPVVNHQSYVGHSIDDLPLNVVDDEGRVVIEDVVPLEMIVDETFVLNDEELLQQTFGGGWENAERREEAGGEIQHALVFCGF